MPPFFRRPALHIALAILLTGLCPVLFAQRDDVQLPRDEASAKQMEDNVSRQQIPSDQVSLYEEIREARTNAGAYKALSARLEDSQKRTPKKDEFDKSIDELSQTVAKCKESKKNKDLDSQILQKIFGIRSKFIQLQLDNEGPLEIPIRDVPEMSKVCGYVTSALLAELKLKYSASLDKQVAALQQQVDYAHRLNTVWQNRFDKLIKEQGTLKTQGDQTQTLLYLLPLIVAIMCGFSLFILRVVKQFQNAPQMEIIASGQVVQFPTVMVLLVVITALGLTKILDANSLSALLGGIGGYVLSQGVGRAAAARAEREIRLQKEQTAEGI